MTSTTAPAPFAAIARRKDVSTACVVLGRFASMEEAHAAANRFREEAAPGVIVAPVTAAYVNARRIVAAL